MAGGLSLVLGALWAWARRSPGALGLAMPLGGRVGLGVAVLVLGALVLAVRSGADGGGADERRRMSELLPTTAAEARLYLLFCLTVGVGWELLYRGYLLWVLTPRVGIVAAVLLAAAAYSLAHGVKSGRMLAGSLVSALLFTTAYALSRSLWGLMLIHAGLPLVPLARARRASGGAGAAATPPRPRGG